MKVSKYKVELTFKETILGSQSSRATMVEDSGHPPAGEDEEEALSEKVERGTTVFHKDENGNPILFNYQVKGFMKNAAAVINGLKLLPFKALKSKVEDHVFVSPRVIPLVLPAGAAMTYNERPVQGMTQQGPRVFILRSEEWPAGCKISFELEVLEGSPIDEKVLRELFDYGKRVGIGQWRNADHGSFTYTLELVQ